MNKTRTYTLWSILTVLCAIAYTPVHAAKKKDCASMKKSLNNYEIACTTSRNITSVCPLIATILTSTCGPFGLLAYIPPAIASGICALNELKKHWYMNCIKGETIADWQKPIPEEHNADDPKHVAALHSRSNAMIQNNDDFKNQVDALIAQCDAQGIDMTDDENIIYVKQHIEALEELYVQKNKQIEEKYQQDLRS